MSGGKFQSSAAARELSVCLIPLTNGVSGTERVVADLAQALAGRGNVVTALVPGESQLNQYATTLGESAVAVGRMGAVAGKIGAGTFLTALNFFKAHRPRIAHFHCPNYKWGLEVIAAARMAGVPVIIRTEQNPMLAPPQPMFAAMMQMTDNAVSGFTYVSEGNRERFERFLPARIERGVVVWNSVDAELFSPKNGYTRAELRQQFDLPASAKIAVAVGTFAGRRSAKPIINALAWLRGQPETSQLAQGWRILLVGKMNDESERQYCAQHSEFVTAVGQRADVERILPACDLWVSASHFEGLSIAMLEAWSAGLPVLTTDVDGIRDVLGADEEAVAMPHADIEGYGRAWAAIMRGDKAALAVQKRGTQRVRTLFTKTRMIDSYFRIYAALTESK